MEEKEKDEIIPINDDAPPVIIPPNQNFDNNNKNMNNNNQNINNNNNKISINNDNNVEEYDLNFDISTDMLNNFDKNLLIDIICFIHYACKIKISSKYKHLSNPNFGIRSNKKKNKEYIFYMRKNLLETYSYVLNKKKYNDKFNILNNINNDNNSVNNSDEEEEENNEENNIINENYKIKKYKNRIKIEKYKHIPEIFFCELHEKLYLDKDRTKHFYRHKKCIKCGVEFPSKTKRKIHMNTAHLENNINDNKKSNNLEILKQNLSQEINDDKIKCTECEKYFDSVELMSAHYYNEHEMKKHGNNNNNKLNEEKEQNKNNEDFIKILKEKEENEKKIKGEEIKSQEMLKNTKYNSNYNGENIKKSLFQFKSKFKIKPIFPCEVCHKIFRDKIAIFQHRRDKGH